MHGVSSSSSEHEFERHRRSPTERERAAEAIARRLDVPFSVLGVVFVLVVLAQTTAAARGSLATALEVVSWLLWAAFVAEFVLRLTIAPSTAGFLKRNWWQLVFLAVPFLRFLRIVRLVRVGRLARVVRVVSSAVRSTRSARRALSSRVAWLAALTTIVVLAASQLLYVLEVFDSYGEALGASAMCTVAGEPLGPETATARTASVVLALYSVVVFASLAGSIGAYLLERANEQRQST